jgi:hypothetical protein
MSRFSGDMLPVLIADLPSADAPYANTAASTGDENGFVRRGHEVVPPDLMRTPLQTGWIIACSIFSK